MLVRPTRTRVARFALVGIVNTAVDVLVYTTLVGLGIGLIAANLVSTTCGLVVSFGLNRAFVFRMDSGASIGTRIREALLFVLTTGVGLWLLQPALILLGAHWLRGTSLTGLAVVLLPKLAATAATLVWNYTFYTLLVFSRARR